MTISQERNNSYFKGNTTYYSSQESSQIQRKDIKTLLFYHARTLFRDKKLEKCIYVLDKLIQLFPKYGDAYLIKALAEWNCDHTEASNASWATAKQLNHHEIEHMDLSIPNPIFESQECYF